ncbi:MAG: hypothetical protein JWL73_3538, partial [Actinomycetia bacterium]|nr:hypothetical protein [Actinomycetes bacterium]
TLSAETARAGRAATVRAIAPRPNWPVPAIVTRAQWGADESKRKASPTYDTPVTKLVVHHTVTPNGSDPTSTVRGIYASHLASAEGYIDIAYNWLIDQFGNIYEGRWAADYLPGVPHTGENAQGQNVHGAHSGSANTDTIGVALLGTFTSATPTPDAVEALVRLLSWKAARWGIDPLGADVYLPGVDGRVFPNICGHRDVTATECPGNAFFAMLNDVRDRVSLRLRTGTDGSWIVGRAGRVWPLGDMPDLGDPQRDHARNPIVGIAAVPNSVGFWAVGSDGGVFTYGSAQFYGSTGALRLKAPVVGMAPARSGLGYWLVASDGGIFTFGDARFFGSTGDLRLKAPVVGMAATPSGNGYWLVASDGGIFTFGDARFFGSTGALRLVAPVVGMNATATGRGYALLAADGGIFTYGDAPFQGSGSGRFDDAIGLATHGH